MKKVITYGSFDLFHEGHHRLLKRAKELGDYLIVGITTEHFDESRGKLNVVDSFMTRYTNVEKSGFADEIIIEDHAGQKVEDIIKYEVDIFAVGSDWRGKFDHLSDFAQVIYLERTRNISSTMLRTQKFQILRIGIIGTGRIAHRFFDETKYVSGIAANHVYNPNFASAERFAQEHVLTAAKTQEEFYQDIDAVYIASPHETHFSYIMESLRQGKHVMCEKPMTLSGKEAAEAHKLAEEMGLVLMEGIKIAYAPGFIQLLGVVRSGLIGNVRDVEATFTKLVGKDLREMQDTQFGGSFTELSSYTLLPIIKLFGGQYQDLRFSSIKDENGIDIYTKAYFTYPNGFACAKTGLGVKSEGQLLISGTKGYILAKSPWWLMQEFQVCFEDTSQNQTYKTQFLGSGLRYELSDFVAKVNGYKKTAERLDPQETVEIAQVIGAFLEQDERG